MAFPTSPSNNQVHRESGSNRTFVYDSTLGVWDQVKEAQSDISNIAGHISNEVTGFAGIKYASQWRVHTTFTGTANPITENWEMVYNPAGFGQIGDPMGGPVAGVFSFPATGIWWIDWKPRTYGAHSTASRMYAQIYCTQNNGSSWLDSGVAEIWVVSGAYTTGYCNYIFDVTSTTTHKVRFSVGHTNTSQQIAGDNYNYNCVTFMRLGDT